ncbi:MAG TPA: PqqD family peptide modification chaperone [Chloroflexota bacterium]|nr:PqqD family peptide modification chaperone [Chloroflexota bacterium]
MLHSRRPRRETGYQLTEAGDDTVDLTRIDGGMAIRLNATSALIWVLCDGERNVADIIDLLRTAFPNSDRDVGADVRGTILALVEAGVVTWEEGFAPPRVEVPILLYHKVADISAPYSSIWVTANTFARQMAALHAYGYTTVSLEDYMLYRQGLAVPPDNPVILTFDDGYECLWNIVRPVLDRYGYKATIFLLTGHTGDSLREDTRWDQVEAAYPAKMMLWSEAIALLADGHYLESHTRWHSQLSTSSESWSRTEIRESTEEMQSRLGIAPRFFAYPYGDGAGMPQLAAVLQSEGYLGAVASQGGIANTRDSDLWALPRIKITEDNSTMLDPAHPDDFFMRQVDPSFPLPAIEVEAPSITDSVGGSDRSSRSYHPGEAVILTVRARNGGMASDVRISLTISRSGEKSVLPIHVGTASADNERTHMGSGKSRSFVVPWRIPEHLSPGLYDVEFTVYDVHRVLVFFSSRWERWLNVEAAGK